uniref:Uncharacterized protein n=1 Tax=Anguilla anguilla TaxID=7936 RepID=A0A0E9X3W2_ANGAN
MVEHFYVGVFVLWIVPFLSPRSQFLRPAGKCGPASPAVTGSVNSHSVPGKKIIPPFLCQCSHGRPFLFKCFFFVCLFVFCFVFAFSYLIILNVFVFFILCSVGSVFKLIKMK